MTQRPARMLGLSAALIPLALAAPAFAQRVNIGQQIERQVLNNMGSALTGQPNYPYQNQAYGPYQGMYGQPGYVQPGGLGSVLQGGRYYQQPGYYPQQNYLNTRTQQGYYTPQQGYYTPQQGYYTPQQPAGSQRYQLPAQYNGTAAGTVVSYGGANYVVNPDGTMSPSAAAPTAQPGSTAAPTAQPAPAAVRYQIPAEFAGSQPGSAITYGGANYIINSDNTMSPTP